MQEDDGRAGDALPDQVAVSKDNPCPFLRALVANGFIEGGTVPLSAMSRTIEAASGERGLRKRLVGIKTFGVALIANGLDPLRLWRTLRHGVEPDHLRNGPLDKHGGGSRILDANAQVHDVQLDRLAKFASDWPSPDGGFELGLNATQIKAFMRANLQRDGAKALWYFPLLMKGEWPVLLRVMGRGSGKTRYLSVAEVRTLFKAREFPRRIVSRLMTKPMPSTVVVWFGRLALGVLALGVLALAAVLAIGQFPDRLGPMAAPLMPEKLAQLIPPPLPPRKVTESAYWLEQNWRTEDRHWFHHVSQGTATFPVPYTWFMALEQPYFSITRPGLLSESAYLERFGFIPSTKSVSTDAMQLQAAGYTSTSDAQIEAAPATVIAGLKPTPADNPDGLPVGFARLSGAGNPVTGASEPDKIGLTCAACHTGSISYKGTSIRFDGGPAMVDLRKLEQVVGLSLFYTTKIPTRFSRFADRVLGPDAGDGARERLKKGLDAALDFALNTKETRYQDAIKAKGQVATYEGFGRLDALNRIGNEVFYLDMARSGLSDFADNQEAVSAPVSFPPIWTVPWFSWAQYDASISQPLVRNAGEALGVSAAINLSPDTVREDLYRSSVAIENLDRIEKMLRGPNPFASSKPTFSGLTSPKWPGKLFAGDPAWTIDPARVARGRKLYAEICVECHLGPVNDPVFDDTYPDKSFWKPGNGHWNSNGPVLNLVEKPVDDMGTDPGQSNILRYRTVKMPGFLGLDPAKDLKGCRGVAPTSTTEMPYATALMDVVQKASEKWMDDHHLSDADRKALLEDRPNCPNPAKDPIYRARPLNGVWATAPYLHNGSVPSLFWMLTPAADRPTSFCQGPRDYDPRDVGFRVPPGGEHSCGTGETRFATTDENGKPISGNSVMGHSFEGPHIDNYNYPKGVIGRGFTVDERYDLIEYLKTL
ncbi:di-heme-cytochrome C peroxidase [Bradyrhizobium sp. STM 3557]|uniref:di-heme-cytochrome C peroxidase n=1 Tax=Bradyrhizobium sp. STM 3557 TaxID=578920 RepID=UPI00388F92BC